ncbi:hypothetical protein O6H91_07G130900 [Diphasiastrum complanatum]|uniref:Uncharacterized protein n=1 Tax=Diphasiastrum complanatum TaxID=34168 RepID=A0ACC2D9V9_DIPCM|nr:hypothetical protein O6H91_07G130900 [Diphasiastrum complanatum]
MSKSIDCTMINEGHNLAQVSYFLQGCFMLNLRGTRGQLFLQKGLLFSLQITARLIVGTNFQISCEEFIVHAVFSNFSVAMPRMCAAKSGPVLLPSNVWNKF